MRLIFILVGLLVANIAFADTNVRGYRKKDGTYVAPHHRSNSNSTQRDNWSSRPNSNPYTGKRGSKEPKK